MLPFHSLRAAGPDDPDLPWRWTEVVRRQRQGEDPTGPWRAAFAGSTRRQYGVAPPPAMPAAFVLQFLLDAAATLGAFAAWHSAYVVDPARDGLSLELHPRLHYPVLLQLRDATATPVLLDERLDAAHAAYRSAATELALTYHPDVNLGPRTRIAMVDDHWAMALARVRGQVPPERASCCFLYVLPGTHECTGCPRLRRRRS